MFRFVAAIAAVTLPTIGLATAPTPSTAVDVGASVSVAVPTSLDPVVQLQGASAEQRATLDAALARFRGADMRLPDLEVRFSEIDADCLGHDGLFDPSRRPWRITVCSGAEFVPTHELAHAWEAAHLDDTDRARYTEARGFETWAGTHVAWGERAMEDAAFVIQQNLMAGDHVDGTSDRWQDRTAAFELLTGHRSPVHD